MDIITITKDNFKEEVYQEEMPVLVQFYQPSCGLCRMMSPSIDEVTTEYKGKIKVGQINTEVESGLTYLFDIQTIPTLMYFKNCEIVKKFEGIVKKEEIIEMLK